MTDDKEARKLKRAGQTCITLFVVFLLSCLGFGQRPWQLIDVPGGGTRLNFSIGCLGLAAAPFAVLFLLRNYKWVLGLPRTRRILGLIGIVGLIAHAAMAVACPRSSGPAAHDASPIGVSGAEQWAVDGKTYQIASTYYVQVDGELQFTIEYHPQHAGAQTPIDVTTARTIAGSLIKHAYLNRLYDRLTVSKLGQGSLPINRIGVLVIDGEGKGANVIRVGGTLDEIKSQISQQSGSTVAR